MASGLLPARATIERMRVANLCADARRPRLIAGASSGLVVLRCLVGAAATCRRIGALYALEPPDGPVLGHAVVEPVPGERGNHGIAVVSVSRSIDTSIEPTICWN